MRMLQVCAVDFTAYHLLGPLLRAARVAGWDVEFACADGPFATQLREEGFTFRRIPMARSASPRLAAAAVSLAWTLRERPVDLIHTHTPAGGIVGRLAALGWHGPVVHTFHGLPFEGRPNGLVEHGFVIAERLLARRTTFFFSQAAGDVPRAAALGICRPADVLVIGNGVDLARFRPDPDARRLLRSELGIPERAVVCVTVSRLVREKGLLELAAAATRLMDRTDLYFVIVGDALPSDRTSVTHELARHEVVDRLGARWRLLGHRPDVARLLKMADVFVLPTYREGLPRSIVEAMATGLPVVATDIPACRELVRAGKTGILVPPRDAAALARAIASLAADAATRATMATEARAVAVAEHDERRVLDLQLNVFRRLVTT